MLRATIVICGILLGLLVAGIAHAVGRGEVLVALQAMLADPWGLVTLLDLGTGLLFVAVWMVLVERRPLRALPWIVALGALGNVVTLVYLLWRSRKVSTLRELFLPAAARRPR